MSMQEVHNARAPDHWRALARESWSTGCFIDGTVVPGDGTADPFVFDLTAVGDLENNRKSVFILMGAQRTKFITDAFG